MSFKDFWYFSDDGLRLYARDYQHAKPQATIICIPGLTRNSADFDRVCEFLSSRYRVLAVDLRGRGRSDYDPNPDNYYPAVYAEDIKKLITQESLNDIILLGTSLGGLVSMLLSALVPERIKAVIMNDVGPEVNVEGLSRIRDYVCNPVAVESWDEAFALTQKLQGSEYPDFTAEDWQSFTKNIYHETASGQPVLSHDPNIAHLMASSDDNAVPPDLWPLFELMNKRPLLLFRGETSDILTVNHVEKMQALHPAMDFFQVPGRGHAPLLSESESLQVLERFLNAIETSQVSRLV